MPEAGQEAAGNETQAARGSPAGPQYSCVIGLNQSFY